MPNCSENPGMAPGTECYKAGSMNLAQGEDDGETPKRNNSTDEDDTAKETPLPVCDGKNGIPKVDCRKPKPLKMCPGN